MGRNLTYKTKLILLGLTLIVLSIVSYHLAIKHSIQLVLNYENQVNIEERAQNAMHEIRRLNARSRQIEVKTKNLINEEDNLRGVLIDKLIPFCAASNILILNISPTHEYENNNYLIETLSVKFSGRFFDILKLTYHFEQISHCGKIVSVKYYSDYNRETLKKEFYAELFFQNIKSQHR